MYPRLSLLTGYIYRTSGTVSGDIPAAACVIGYSSAVHMSIWGILYPDTDISTVCDIYIVNSAIFTAGNTKKPTAALPRIYPVYPDIGSVIIRTPEGCISTTRAASYPIHGSHGCVP